MKNNQAKFLLQLLALLKNRCNQSWLFLSVLISVALFGCGTGSGPTSITDPTTGKTLNLIWADEFNGAALDANKWNVETGYGPNNDGWGNSEWQLYSNSGNNIKVDNGNLVITARCDSGNCGSQNGSVTSGKINTKGKFATKSGTIQARIKIPDGRGMWSAFWMLGANYPAVEWPKCGEIDIFEAYDKYSTYNTVHTTLHWFDSTTSNNMYGTSGHQQYPDFTSPTESKNSIKTLPQSLGNDYHVYEISWNADRIIGRIDGAEYFRKTIDPTKMEEFLKDCYLILNLAVGGTLANDPPTTGPWTQSMYVDYVRVYGSPPPTEAGLFSETKTDAAVSYASIKNSAEWSGDSAIPNQTSTDVTPKEGKYVLSVQYLNDKGKSWNGVFFDFGSVSVAEFGSYFFSVDTSGFPNFKDIQIEFKDSPTAIAGFAGSVVKLSSLTPALSGNWATYQIPLKSVAAQDLSKLALLGYVNPENASGTRIPGTLYFDDLYFGVCTVPATVKFAAASYAANAKKATVSVSDPCAGAAPTSVKVRNGTDQIFINVTLNSSGSGTATVNLGATDDITDTILISSGATLTASYTGASSAVVTGSTAITAPVVSVVVGDVAPKDGFVYLYATNPATVIDFVGARDYTVIDNWGSGSTYNFAYADAVYNPVVAITPGGGWGVNAGVLAYTGFTPGFADTYSTLHFKYKGATQVTVNFSNSGTGLAEIKKENIYLASSAKALNNGWYQFDINMTDFPNTTVYKAFGIFNIGSTTLYVTDIYFD